MALSKTIELENGVVVNYHRITSIHIITNIHNIIEITSYTSENKRRSELDAIQTGEDYNVFIHNTFINVPYDQNATIESTYEYLKTLPEFEGAEDC